MKYTSTTHGNKNNLVGGGAAGSMEALTQTDSWFEFSLKWLGNDGLNFNGLISSPNQPSAGLLPLTLFPVNLDFGDVCYKDGHLGLTATAVSGNTYPINVGQIPVVSVDWVGGTQLGTIKENYYAALFDGAGNITSRTLVGAIDNIDPGNYDGGASGLSGRRGQRYRFALAGKEIIVYKNYNGLGSAPIFKIASDKHGMGFPLSLACFVPAGFAVVSVNAGASTGLATILSVRDQNAMFGATQSNFHFRVYENSRHSQVVNGFPIDVDV
jgi:hypothetical protein